MGGPSCEKPDQGSVDKSTSVIQFTGDAVLTSGGDELSKHNIQQIDLLPVDDLLLKNLDKMTVRTHTYKVSTNGCLPRQRSIREYLQNGFINLDKPANPSSHEVVSWVKKILPGLDKTGHSGTLDPKVTGCLIVCLERATKLVKLQQGAGKEYVAVVRFHKEVPGGEAALAKVLEIMHGALFQRPPLISAVKRVLRIRTVNEIKLLEFDNSRGLACIWISCEAGTYIRTFCVHLGLILGVGAHMQELRRVRSGVMSENKDMYTLHDILEARTLMEKTGDETRLRKIVQPLEALLVGMPRLLIKDSAVSAVCHGGQLMLVGVIAFDNTVVPGIDVVIMTGKGEAVAIATAMMTVQQMAGANSTDHNAAAKVKRVLLDRDAYPKQWGLGPHAMEKKKHRLLGDKPLLPSSSFVEAANASTASTTAPITEEEAVQKDGKRKRDVESAEEKAERKKRKAEKKAAKEEAK